MKGQRATAVSMCAFTFWLMLFANAANGQTAFTWSGWLIDGIEFLDGQYDLRFTLYPEATGGVKLGEDFFLNNVPVRRGYISRRLNFGVDVCDNQIRYLEIAQRPGGSGDLSPYEVLNFPRQELLRTHHTIMAETIAIGRDPGEQLSVAEGISLCDAGDTGDLWTDGLVIGNGRGGVYGVLGSQGSYRLGLSWNGYRRRSETGVEWEVVGIEDSDTTAQVQMGDDGISLCVEDGRVDGDAGPAVRMKILPNGNVGIGTNSPPNALTVNGKIQAYGGFIQHNAAVPEDIWAKNQLYLSPAGFIGTQGSHGVDISWNGYRNNTDGTFGWLGIYDLQEASSISLNHAGILFWADEAVSGDFRRTARMAIKNNGNVGIGTTNPAYKLDVQGDVQANAYHTGDIFFQKDGRKLWRMFEDEAGLYVENLTTGKNYSLVLQEVANGKSADDDSTIAKMKAQNATLEQRVTDLEAKLTVLVNKIE